MKTILSRTILVLSASVFVLWVVFSSTQVRKYLGQLLISELAGSGINTSATELLVAPLNLSGSGLNVSIPAALLQLRFDTLTAKVPLLSLLSSPSFSVEGTAYRGRLEALGNFTGPRFNPTQSVNLARLLVDKLMLFEHPQLAGLGVSEGILTLNVRDLLITRPGSISGEIKCNVENLSTAFDVKLPLAIPLKLPKIEQADFKLETQIIENKVTVAVLLLTSRWGTLDGNGTFTISPSGKIKVLSADMQMVLSLTSSGATQWGPLLTLANQGRISDTARRLLITIKGSGPSPMLQWVKVVEDKETKSEPDQAVENPEAEN